MYNSFQMEYEKFIYFSVMSVSKQSTVVFY